MDASGTNAPPQGVQASSPHTLPAGATTDLYASIPTDVILQSASVAIKASQTAYPVHILLRLMKKVGKTTYDLVEMLEMGWIDTAHFLKWNGNIQVGHGYSLHIEGYNQTTLEVLLDVNYTSKRSV